jgi:hypothetical protein
MYSEISLAFYHRGKVGLHDSSFTFENLDLWIDKFLPNINIIDIIIFSVIICIVIFSIITYLFMEKGQEKWDPKKWPWLDSEGRAINMPGPYKPGPGKPSKSTVEPKYKGPKGPSKPNFGDPGLSRKN